MPERETPRVSRRTVLTGLASGALLDQGPRILELTDRKTHVRFVSGQEQNAFAQSGVVVLGGFSVRNARYLAESVTPTLESLGPVMYTEYAKNGMDIPSVADTLLRLQNVTGISRLSLYGQSVGALAAGELVERIGDRFQFDHIFMDSTPTSFDDLRGAYKSIGKIAAKVPVYEGGFIPNAIANTIVYQNPVESSAAWAGLSWNELMKLQEKESRKNLTSLARVVERDGSSVVLLTSQYDPVVDSDSSERRLRTFFPELRRYTLKGLWDHAVSVNNPEIYNKTLIQAINDSEAGLN